MHVRNIILRLSRKSTAKISSANHGQQRQSIQECEVISLLCEYFALPFRQKFVPHDLLIQMLVD